MPSTRLQDEDYSPVLPDQLIDNRAFGGMREVRQTAVGASPLLHRKDIRVPMGAVRVQSKALPEGT